MVLKPWTRPRRDDGCGDDDDDDGGGASVRPIRMDKLERGLVGRTTFRTHLGV